MAKPPKTPRPKKPAIQPSDPNAEIDPTVGLLQEKLIGRAVIEWAKLEGCMGDSIHELLGVSFEKGRIITARMDATSLLRTMRELGQISLPQEKYHLLSTICDRIDILREDRNLIVHGTWGRHGGGPPASMSLRIKPETPSEIVSETFSHNRMREIISDIVGLKLQLVLLFGLGTPPYKRDGQSAAK